MKSGNNSRVSTLSTRVGRFFTTMAGSAIRGTGAPTQIISIPGSSQELSQRHARLVIDLCLRAGESMLATGASSADVVATVLRISTAYGVSGMHVDISFTSITVSIHRGEDEDPLSVMRIVKVRTTDYTRLQNVYLLIDEITGPGSAVSVNDARGRLSAILTSPRPYRRWVVVLGKAILAGGVVVLFDVSFILVLVAAVTAVITDGVGRRLEKLAVPEFFTQMTAASVTTAIAVFIFWLRSVDIDIPGSNHPTVIVISGIVMLLSGIGLTASARDAIDGYYVTATARGMEVLMLTLGLAVGISLVLGVSLRMGVPISVATSLGDNISLVPGMAGAALIGVGFALTSYMRFRLVPLMAIAATVVFAVYALVLPETPQPGFAPAIAGVVAGVIGYFIYRWIKVPEGATAMAGIIALIPGLAVYRAIYALMGSESGATDALPAMVVAIATGIGLAAGTAIGGFTARRIFGLDRAAIMSVRRARLSR